MYQSLEFKCSVPQAFPYPCWAGFANDIFNQCLLLCVACLSTGGDSAAFWNVWWYDGSLTRPVPVCIRSPLSPPPSLKLQIFGSTQHLSHMRSRPHLEYQMFFPVWGSLVLIIRLSLHIRKILYFTKSCLWYQFPHPFPTTVHCFLPHKSS